MRNRNRLKWIAQCVVLLAMGVGMNADAGLFGIGGTSWKEEVLLHDGSKIVVERWAIRGGRHEIGQQPPIKEQRLAFVLPTTGERIAWKREHSADVGLADLEPVLVDVVRGTVYLVATPVGCLSYNKWNRPNPPYVIFGFQSSEWQRIALQHLPAEIKAPNLIISSPDSEVERSGKSFMDANDVKRTNGSLRQPELRTILREPVKSGSEGSLVNCEERVLYKGSWVLPDDSIARKMIDRRTKK